MRGPNDKPPTPLEVDAAAYAQLESISKREGLHHYRKLLAEVLPTLRAKGLALARAATPPEPEPTVEESTAQPEAPTE